MDMKLGDISLTDIVTILELYEEHCGPGLVPITETDGYAREVLESLKKGYGGNYRYGSRWNEDSNLQITIDIKDEISVQFYHNIHDPILERFKKEAESKGKVFDTAVKDYLNP